MFDGGSSTQMICEGVEYISSSRSIPQSIAVLYSKKEFYLLSGTLTDANGNPAQGWVYATETSGANLGNQVYTYNGTYEMALFPGNYHVYASVTNSYPQGSYNIRTPFQTIPISADTTLDIQVPSHVLYHLTGKVTDKNSVGLANIRVEAYHNSGTCQSYTTTDNNGNFDALLIGGTYYLYFRPPQDSAFLEERVDNVPIYSNITQNISLTSSEHTLSGTLTYADGSPAIGWVYAFEVNGPAYRYVWSSNGTYQMALAPGNYRVYAYVYTTYGPGYTKYTRITTPYQTVSVSGDTHFNIAVPPHDFYHLTGKVTDINNIIQPNVKIEAYDKSEICYGQTTTDTDGSYELFLMPGTYSLRISAPPATYPPFEIKKLIVAGDSVRNIRLSLEYTLLEEALALLRPDLALALDVFDIIDQAAKLNYNIPVQGAKALLQVILNWQGSEMKVTLYEPSGNVYGEYQSTEPPINVEVPNPAEGVWKCEVTAVDIPNDNYPFALVAGISPNQAPIADANGPYSGTPGSPITFNASSSYDPDGEIVFYEWDWDNNGIYDESTISPTMTHTWTESYSGSVALRVKDNEGATAVDTASVEVISNQPPVAMCKNVTVNANDNCQGNASVDNGSYDPDGDPITITQSPAGPYSLGSTEVTLTVTDSLGTSDSCTGTVTVVDTTQPSINSVSASPNVLWPPDHKMRLVSVNVSSTDNCSATPICKITSVSSNEPENGLGDGDTAPDWEITGNLTANLRAERSGTGSGRVYTISIMCTDASENSSTGNAIVTVPHDLR
jgi:hypothetical protein